MSNAEWPQVLFLLLIAPAIGSFLGVMVERLPRGQSVLDASHCASCNRPLKWRDMIPFLSALLLNGTCRSCGDPFPQHLFRLEIAAFLMALLAVGFVPEVKLLCATVVFLWLLLGLFYCDLLYFRLPDPLTIMLFVAGMALAQLDPSRGWIDGALSSAIGFGAFLAIRWGYFALRGQEGLGLGDVKLMGGLGAALGWAALPWLTLIAAILALSVTGLEALRGRELKKDAPLPFGSYLCAAAVLLVIW